MIETQPPTGISELCLPDIKLKLRYSGGSKSESDLRDSGGGKPKENTYEENDVTFCYESRL